MSRACHGKHDRVGDVFSRERGNTLVHVVCGLLVTFVTHYGEFGFDHSRSDVGYLDVVFQHIDAHGFRKGIHGVFGGTVYIPTGINFLACHGGDVDDMSFFIFDHQRGYFMGDVKKAFHVGVDHAFPIIQNSVLDRRSSHGKTCIID